MVQAQTIVTVVASWAALAALEVLFFAGVRRIQRARSRGAALISGAPMPGQRFTLGGRVFIRPERTPVRQDQYVLDVLRSAKIAEPNLLPDETPDDYVKRIYAELEAKHKLPALLSAIVLPEDAAKWSQDAAREIEEFLLDVDDPLDKATEDALVGDAVLRPFCRNGAGFLLRSPTSGRRASSSEPATSPAVSPATGRV